MRHCGCPLNEGMAAAPLNLENMAPQWLAGGRFRACLNARCHG